MAWDDIDEFCHQWAQELPGVDTTGMTILGRARRITLRVRPAIEAVFARYGLDAGEFDVMATLLRSGAPYRLRPTEIYRSLMISSGGLTARLGKLAAAGHIVRRTTEGDGRSFLVELTDSGRDLVTRAFTEDMALEANMLSGLSAAEQTALAALLKKAELAMVDEDMVQ